MTDISAVGPKELINHLLLVGPFLKSYYVKKKYVHVYVSSFISLVFCSSEILPPMATRLTVQDVFDENGKPLTEVLKQHFIREGRIDEEAALRIISDGTYIHAICLCVPYTCCIVPSTVYSVLSKYPWVLEINGPKTGVGTYTGTHNTYMYVHMYTNHRIVKKGVYTCRCLH